MMDPIGLAVIEAIQESLSISLDIENPGFFGDREVLIKLRWKGVVISEANASIPDAAPSREDY